jgi:hypothetical protein
VVSAVLRSRGIIGMTFPNKRNFYFKKILSLLFYASQYAHAANISKKKQFFGISCWGMGEPQAKKNHPL